MYYDDTGHCPVFRGCQSWVYKGQSLLFYWQSGDPLLWCSLPQSLKYLRNEGLLQRLLYRAEGVAYAGGNPLHECPLLLE